MGNVRGPHKGDFFDTILVFLNRYGETQDVVVIS